MGTRASPIDGLFSSTGTTLWWWSFTPKVNTQAATIQMPPRPMMAGPANDRLWRWYSIERLTVIVVTVLLILLPLLLLLLLLLLPSTMVTDVDSSSARNPTTHIAVPMAIRSTPGDRALANFHTQPKDT